MKIKVKTIRVSEDFYDRLMAEKRLMEKGLKEMGRKPEISTPEFTKACQLVVPMVYMPPSRRKDKKMRSYKHKRKVHIESRKETGGVIAKLL